MKIFYRLCVLQVQGHFIFVRVLFIFVQAYRYFAIYRYYKNARYNHVTLIEGKHKNVIIKAVIAQ